MEVNRPDRQGRRRGKSDAVDADAAARTVQAGEATAVPKAQDGVVEMVRSLRVARHSAVKARTKAVNAVKALLVTAPAGLRERLDGLPTAALVRRAAALEPAGWRAQRRRACWQRAASPGANRHLDAGVRLLCEELERLTARRAPALRARPGAGPEVAAALLVCARDNPAGLRSEAAFAALCGTSPVEASSGMTRRHRLNRGGTGRPTPRCTGSWWCGCAGTSPPATTWPGAPPRARPPKRSCAASSATSPGRSSPCYTSWASRTRQPPLDL